MSSNILIISRPIKRCIYSLALCNLMMFSLTGQTNDELFSGGMSSTILDLSSLCKPGVVNKSRSKGLEISYQYTEGNTYKQDSEAYSFIPIENSFAKRIENFKFKLKVPIILRKKIKVIAGYEYAPEVLRFSSVGNFNSNAFNSINNRLLKKNSFSIIFSRPWNNKIYSTLQFKTSYSGDFNSWISTNEKYRSISIGGIIGFKQDPYTEYGFGLAYSDNIRKSLIVPFFMYNKTFNEKWGIEATIPSKIMGRYNCDTNSILLFGIEYNSRNYVVDITNESTNQNTNNYFRQSAIRALVSLERKIVPWVWANVRVGYQKNFDTIFDARAFGGQAYRMDVSNPLFFRVGLFLSPPDDFMK